MVGARLAHRQRARLEGIAINLSGSEARHLGECLKVARNHVRRQGFGKRRTQITVGYPDSAFKHDVGNKLIDTILRTQNHSHRAHARLARQSGFNLTKFDAKTSYFYLVVGTAQAMNLAVGTHAGQVSGAVQTLAMGVTWPRIGQKFFCRQTGSAQVSLGQTRAGNAEFSDLAARHGLQAILNSRINDQQTIIGQRFSDGHGHAGLQRCHAG